MRYAVIENNIVINIIEAESLEVAARVTGATCLETTEENCAHIGLGWDGVSFEHPPVMENPEHPPVV